MSDPSKQSDQEPSIEEILSSIRQIISDDEDDEDSKKTDPVENVSEPEDEDEPIVLTQRVDPDPVPDFGDFMDEAAEKYEDDSELAVEIDMRDIEPEPEEKSEPDFNVAFDEPEAVIVPDPVPAKPREAAPARPRRPEPRYEEPTYSADEEEEPLLTKRAEDAAYGAFKKLAVKTAVDSISGITIEEIVRDELRPMLRVWLDENLPTIVERLVREELDRVARRALEE